MTKLVYEASWTKLDTEGKIYGRNNHAITVVKQLRDWAAQIATQQTSGMTVQKWCAENGIYPKTYYYHLRKLREKMCSISTGNRTFGSAQCASGIHIEKDGLQICLPTDISAETLIALVHELC